MAFFVGFQARAGLAAGVPSLASCRQRLAGILEHAFDLIVVDERCTVRLLGEYCDAVLCVLGLDVVDFLRGKVLRGGLAGDVSAHQILIAGAAAQGFFQQINTYFHF